MEEQEKNEQIDSLHERGILHVSNETLENIKKHYHEGKRGIHIFEPPPIGADILLLQHFISTRDSINNRYMNEPGFEREWTIYRVEGYVLEDMDDPRNQLILSYKVMKSPQRKRRVDFRDIFSGYFYPKIITKEEIEIIQKYRRLVDETFNIHIV